MPALPWTGFVPWDKSFNFGKLTCQKTPNHHQTEQAWQPFTLKQAVYQVRERLTLNLLFRTLIPETLDMGLMSEASLSSLMCVTSLPRSAAHGPLLLPQEDDYPGPPRPDFMGAMEPIC